MKRVEIVSDSGHKRTLELVRFEGDTKPLAIVRWSGAGTYQIDLGSNRLRHSKGVIVTNWRAVDVEDLRAQHAAWRRERHEKSKPAILKGGR